MTTIVTGFFDLARREAGSTRRSAEDYLKHGQYVMNLPLPLVVFCDPEFVEAITAMRPEKERERTMIIGCPFELLGKWSQYLPGYESAEKDLAYYDLLPRIIECRQKNPVANASGIKDTSLYMAMTWSKFQMLSYVSRTNPFTSTHFGWLDFGITHVANTTYCEQDQIFTQPAERIRLLMMKPFSPEEFLDERAYFGALRGNLAAGYIAGSRWNIQRLCQLMASSIQTSLLKGFAPSEEQILPMLGHKYPELFEYYYGDYAGILSNYRQPRLCMNLIIYNLRVCRERGYYYRGCEVGHSALTSIDGGTFGVSEFEYAHFLSEYYVSAYRLDRNLAVELARRFCLRVASHSEFRLAFLSMQSRIQQNFSFLAAEIGSSLAYLEEALKPLPLETPVYCINLRKRADRKAQMVKRLAAAGLTNSIFVEATTQGDPLLDYYAEGLKREKSEHYIDDNLYGCFISHLRALQAFVQSNEEECFICEDDVVFRNDFSRKWREVKKNVPEGTTLVMPCYIETVSEPWSGLDPSLGNLKQMSMHSTWGTQMYWVSRAYAQACLEKFDRPFREIPVDSTIEFLTSELITRHSQGLLTVPILAIEDTAFLPEDSTITSDLRSDIRNQSNYFRRFDLANFTR